MQPQLLFKLNLAALYTQGVYRLLILLLATSLSRGQIVVDTDAAKFGDDGVALAMLMRSPLRTQVKGIITVSGDAWSLASANYLNRISELLEIGDVPIAVGSEEPLIHTRKMAQAEGPLEFSGAFSSQRPEPRGQIRGGVELLIREIEMNPGKVRILAIGPLTNIAIVLRLRPDLSAKIGSLTIMGGAVAVPGNTNKTAEFNFWFDPEAASIVLRSSIPNKSLIPLDVCNTAMVTRAVFDSIADSRTPLADLYRDDFGNRYPGFLRNPKAKSYLWDELAVAVLINPSVITKSSLKYLDVSTTFGRYYGAVKSLDQKLHPEATQVRVIERVDLERVFAMYKSALTAR